jgi:hypothetical protein
MKKIAKLFLLVGIILFSSCELDYLDSPNDVTLSSSNPDYLLNRIQIDFAGFFDGTGDRGARVTRMFHQGSDTYEISHQAVNQDGTWSTAYASMLNDIKALKEVAETSNFKRHLGMAKVLEAYILMTLVDQFGDVPYSQALDPQNFNPNIDGGAAVYAQALTLLQTAETDFADASSIGTPNDYFYGNNATKWIRLSNTLQLKHHLNLRLTGAAAATTAIQALITENNFLQAGDDFVFKYGKSQSDPDSRHPMFAGQYPNGGGDYQSTYYMWHLTEAKKGTPGDGTASPDPRANYYFYRQTGSNPTLASEKECIADFPPLHYPVGMPWCMPGVRGYWGRDHLDPDGIPPDGLRRTLYGLYPGGHIFDDNTPGPMAAAKSGNGGAGIQPIMLTAFVDFMLSEVALTLGIGDAKALLLSGITKHINYVRTWSLTTTEASRVTAFASNATHDTRRNAYVTIVDNAYTAATTNTQRMRIIATEYWIALFGNGNEAYNLYRRTGMPDNMQLGQIASFGNFPRSFFYPNDFVVRNSSVEQKASHNVQVFWENNPAGFIN